MAFHVPNEFRVRTGDPRFATDDSWGNAGLFIPGNGLRIIASDGEGWEHVSVSRTHRCPTWEEMCWVKDRFWDADDCVAQFHPPKADYVNFHPYCLHLWRPTTATFPRPPSWMVGPKA